MSNRRRSTSAGSSTGSPQSTVGDPSGWGSLTSRTATISGTALRRAVSLGEGGEGVGAQERLPFERVERAVLGGSSRRTARSTVLVDPAVELQAGLGIEPASQAPHPLVVDPRVEPGGPPLTGRAGSIPSQHSAGPSRRSTPCAARPASTSTPGFDQPPGRRGDRLAVAWLEVTQHPADGVDVAARHRPVVERLAQRRDHLHGARPLHDPVGVTRRRPCRAGDDLLGTGRDLRQPGRERDVRARRARPAAGPPPPPPAASASRSRQPGSTPATSPTSRCTSATSMAQNIRSGCYRVSRERRRRADDERRAEGTAGHEPTISPAEGSASDEAHATRGESERQRADDEPAINPTTRHQRGRSPVAFLVSPWSL